MAMRALPKLPRTLATIKMSPSTAAWLAHFLRTGRLPADILDLARPSMERWTEGSTLP